MSSGRKSRLLSSTKNDSEGFFLLHKGDQSVIVVSVRTILKEEAVKNSSMRCIPEATNPGVPLESARGDSREGGPIPAARKVWGSRVVK